MSEFLGLTADQRKQFIEEGYTVLRGAFSGEDSLAWVREECLLKGYDLDSPATWTKPYDRVSTQRRRLLTEFSPVIWHSSCEAMGGEERVVSGTKINLFAMNFCQGADQPFEPASPQSRGWHKDGWHFRHFLDSYEQGLLGIPLLTDVKPSGGATFIAAGSVGPVARFLADHPEGVHPNGFPFRQLLSEPGIQFLEATGEAGDYYLIHPYLLNAVSQNVLRLPRAISNLLFELREPMNLDRADGNYSLVEQGILHGLGVDRYPFQIKGERYRTPDYGPMPELQPS